MRLLLFIGAVVWQTINTDAVIPLNTVIRSVNTFSNNVVKAIAEDASGNLVFSPISADIVLSMATYGARGKTEKVLRSALALHDDDAVTLNGFQSLVDTLTSSKGYELRFANKIFLGEGVEPTVDFKDVAETAFRSPTGNVDFRNPTEASRIINDWTEAQTNNRIKDLVQPDDLIGGTALVLVNAIHFRGDWEHPFSAELTKRRTFYVDGRRAKNVPIMRNFGIFKHGELHELDATFVELPYKSDSNLDGVSMFVILPEKKNGIDGLAKNLDKLTVERLKSGTESVVTVYLPKFRVESSIDLEKPLVKLGLSEIFSNNADFSAIADNLPLKVSKILQKAFIDVNEEGTEATAATEIQFTLRSGAGGGIEFNVNHPFVAVIATNRGVPLFSSVITEPIY